MRARLALLLMAGILFLPACPKGKSGGNDVVAQNISVGKVERTDAQRLVSIQSIQVFPTSIGPAVAGEVQNVSSDTVRNVKVTVKLKDRAGKAIAEEFGFTLLEVVPPGVSAPFFVPFTKGKSTAGSIEAKVEAQAGGAAGTGFLVVSDEKGELLGPVYEVSGTVRNRHNRAVDVAKVVATFYDASGKVIGGAVAFIEPSTLKPGETATFRVVQGERAKDVVRFTLVTEARLAG